MGALLAWATDKGTETVAKVCGGSRGMMSGVLATRKWFVMFFWLLLFPHTRPYPSAFEIRPITTITTAILTSTPLLLDNSTPSSDAVPSPRTRVRAHLAHITPIGSYILEYELIRLPKLVARVTSRLWLYGQSRTGSYSAMSDD